RRAGRRRAAQLGAAEPVPRRQGPGRVRIRPGRAARATAAAHRGAGRANRRGPRRAVDRLNSMTVFCVLSTRSSAIMEGFRQGARRGGGRAGRAMRHPSFVIELRVLTPGDWAGWRARRLGAPAEAPYAFRSWMGGGDRAERWRARLSVPGSFNVVALPDGVAELVSLWVSPAARGHGIGDQLMQ